MSYTYILQSESGKFYIGYTKNLEARVAAHQADEGGWTAGKGPWRLRYYESYEEDSDARKREIALKRKKRSAFYEWLINNGPGSSVG